MVVVVFVGVYLLLQCQVEWYVEVWFIGEVVGIEQVVEVWLWVLVVGDVDYVIVVFVEIDCVFYVVGIGEDFLVEFVVDDYVGSMFFVVLCCLVVVKLEWYVEYWEEVVIYGVVFCIQWQIVVGVWYYGQLYWVQYGLVFGCVGVYQCDGVYVV